MYRFFPTEISTIFAVEEQWISIRKCVLFVVLDSLFSALGSFPDLILFQCQHGRQCHFYYFATLWLCEHLRVMTGNRDLPLKLKQWPQTSMLCYFFVNLWQWGWCQDVTVTCPEALSQRGRQCHCQCSFSCQRCWLGFWQNALIWNQAVVVDKFAFFSWLLAFLIIQKPLQWKYFKWPLRRPDHTLMIMKMTF